MKNKSIDKTKKKINFKYKVYNWKTTATVTIM